MTSPLPLAGGFPTYSEDDWRAAATGAKQPSAGRDSEVAAGRNDSLAPRKRGARAIVGAPPGSAWSIVERVDTGDAAGASRLVDAALAGGAAGIEVVLPLRNHPLAQHADAEPHDLAATIALPAGCHLRINAGPPTATAFDAFLDLAAKRKCELVWEYDPVAARAIGVVKEDEESAIRGAATAFADREVGGAVLIADGRLWHAGGATEEQELGLVLATYASHVRLLGSAERIALALTADADQFRTIAKFRAMRLLVARVVEVAGLPATPVRIHAETAWRSLSALDPDVNILRATSAAFGAAAGGADSIAILPHDAAVDPCSNAARRLARNTQIILAEEACFGRVADPGAGSDVIETLTAAFAEAAWKRFQSVEAEGGAVAAIAEGSLLREVAEAREARLARVARADLRLVGVNAFREDAATATVKRAPVKRTGPLTFKRLPELFEATR